VSGRAAGGAATKLDGQCSFDHQLFLTCSMSQTKELGTLVVVILKARHLHQPSFYKQDPYAQAVLSGQTQRTKPEPKGGQHPVWDEEFRFPVLADPGKDKVNRKLEVSCWKDESRSEDKLLGKGIVDIESTLKTGEFDGKRLIVLARSMLTLSY
jgi:Ca2+-dependent lipid-binding protein